MTPPELLVRLVSSVLIGIGDWLAQPLCPRLGSNSKHPTYDHFMKNHQKTSLSGKRCNWVGLLWGNLSQCIKPNGISCVCRGGNLKNENDLTVFFF